MEDDEALGKVLVHNIYSRGTKNSSNAAALGNNPEPRKCSLHLLIYSTTIQQHIQSDMVSL